MDLFTRLMTPTARAQADPLGGTTNIGTDEKETPKRNHQ